MLASDAVLIVKSCQDSMRRSHLSVEASLGITVGFDMLLAAVSIAFMARRFSSDIVRWGAQKLQPGREKVRQLRAKQVVSQSTRQHMHRLALHCRRGPLHHCCILSFCSDEIYTPKSKWKLIEAACLGSLIAINAAWLGFE